LEFGSLEYKISIKIIVWDLQVLYPEASILFVPYAGSYPYPYADLDPFFFLFFFYLIIIIRRFNDLVPIIG